MFPTFPPHTPLLVALDLGLRFGWAFYTQRGTLIGYGSHHCSGRVQLKKCAYTLIQTLPPESELWIEGGGALLKFWTKPAVKRNLVIHTFHAHQWRKICFDLHSSTLSSLSSKEAKLKAIEKAKNLIELQSQQNQKRHLQKIKKTSTLRHDTAEAILMGWWALLQTEWIEVGSFRQGLKNI